MNSLIFDFDGVLADTLLPVSKFLSRLTFQPVDKVRAELLELLMQNHKENFFQRHIKDLLSKPMENYLAKIDNLIFEDRLVEISQIPVPKAILSNNYSFICKKLLGTQAAQFEMIVGDNDADTKVKGFEVIFNNPNFKKENTLFITDSVGDILEASKVLPIEQIFAVDWGFHSPELLKKYLPKTQILSDFKKLQEILKLKLKQKQLVKI